MTYGALIGILQHIRRLAVGAEGRGLDDCQLLDRFLRLQDERAFEALVARHGPLVLGVCRRFLTNPLDVEDAFQATFLVLLRKAPSLGRRELVANWLYGVAYRTALKARSAAARRRIHEKQVSHLSSAVAQDEGLGELDLGRTIDEEIKRLPTKYRLPIILCCLEGLTLREASRQLGWPVGTVSGRLARGRALMQRRLTRRGVTLSAAGVGTLLAEGGQAAAPVTLVDSTIKAAAAMAATHTAGAVVSAPAAALTEGVIRAMFLTKLYIGLSVVGIGVVGTGGGTLLYERFSSGSAGPQQAEAPRDRLPEPAIQTKRQDVKDDNIWLSGMENMRAAVEGDDPPMPNISLPRMKSLLENRKIGEKMRALLKAQFEAADTEARARWHEFLAGRGTIQFLLGSSQRLLEAERDLGDKKSDHLVALENHVKRMRAVEEMEVARFQAGRISIQELAESRFDHLQSEIQLERAREDAQSGR
jgi:RNA polymerase sigma factor (sigma-70 family)